MTYFNKTNIILGLFLATVWSATAQNSTSSFAVAGICGMCKARSEKAADGSGLTNAHWDASTHLLTLTHNAKYDVKAAKQRILAAGHDVDSLTAPQAAYEKLPACCQYHDEKNVHKVSGRDDNDDHTVTGVIMQENNRGELSPIMNANVHWLEDATANARSDESGVFRIAHDATYKRLVISYAGLQPDTVAVTDPHEVVVITRSEERRVGNECVSTCRSRWSQYH